MGQLLAEMEVAEEIKEDGDFLGGYEPFESGISNFNVELAYISLSKGGAKAMNLVLKEGNREMRTQLWMTSGTAKGCLPYYINKKNQEKKFLPGYVLASHLALLAAGKKLTTLETETKTINLYNMDAKAEVPTQVEMVTALLGKAITAGVIKQIVDKNVLGADGQYHPSGETRTENEVDKFFRTRDGMTVTEVMAQSTTAEFLQKWSDRWTGQIRDRSTAATGVAGGVAAPVAAPAAGGAADAAALFA